MGINAVNVSWFAAPCELDVGFSVLGASVGFTAEDPRKLNDVEGEDAGYGFVVISSRVSVEDFDSAHEAARYARPGELVILGILSYLTGYHFSVYDNVCSRSAKEPAEIDDLSLSSNGDVPIWLLNEGTDLTLDLEMLVKAIQDEPEDERNLLFSLLDRWRRAQFLLQESEAGLHHEEAYLGFFHVLELLAMRYAGDQRVEAEERLREFVTDLLASTLKMRGPKLDQAMKAKVKGLKELLLSPETFSISQRVLYMLDQYDVLEPRIHKLVEDLVKTRNQIAHGRTTFRQGLVWPVPPFFSILSQHSDLVEVLCVFSARVVALRYGLSSWGTQWQETLDVLDPPWDIVRSFVQSDAPASMSRADFQSGVIDNVRPGSLVRAYLHEKIAFRYLERTLRRYLLDTTDPDDLPDELTLAVVVLADASDEELAGHCQQLVPDLVEHRLGVFPKDILRMLEDRRRSARWFREYLQRS